MENLFNVFKPIGLTPFQLIKEFKKQYKQYKNIPVSHAGKLDPLAEGVMLLIAGNEINNIKKFMNLDKVYNAKILFGFSTDSYDVQGLPVIKNINIDIDKLKEIIKSLKGNYEQTLPPFSGRVVDGKPLFYWARTNQLKKINIPKENIKIYGIKLNKIEKISSKYLLKEILEKINLLEGDFRQDKIIKSWTDILKNVNVEYLITDITINVSSGTYIRGIANDLGKKLGSGGVLLDLIRTKIGNFDINESIRLKN